MIVDRSLARQIIGKAVLRQYPIKGKIEKYNRNQIVSFLLDVIEGKIEEFSPAQEGMWRQIVSDFSKWIRLENARKEGRL